MELLVMALVVGATGALILWPLLRGTESEEEAAGLPADRSREKELALAAIRELEFDYATGKISQEDYALLVAGRLKEAGLRAEADTRPERMQARIRDAELRKVPYVLVVGEKEKAEGTVSVRRRHRGNLGAMPLAAFLEGVLREYRERRLESVF